MKPILSTIQFSRATDEKTSRTIAAILTFIRNSGVSIKRACESVGIDKSDFYTVFQLLTEQAPNSFRHELIMAPINRNHISHFYLMRFDLDIFNVEDSGVQSTIEFDARDLLSKYPFLHPIGKPRIHDVEAVNLRGESAKESVVDSVAGTSRNRAHPDSLQMKRWASLSFSNETTLNVTTSKYEAYGDCQDIDATTLTAHQSSRRYNEDPDPNERLSVSVTMYVPVMVVNPPSDFDIDEVRRTILNQVSKVDNQKDEPMGIHDEILLTNFTYQLLHTNKPINKIVEAVAPGLSMNAFYEIFKKKYQCTPEEYLELHRPKQQGNPSPSKSDQPFDFDVVVQKSSPARFGAPHTHEIDLQASPDIPLVVNECFEYVAYLIVKSGVLPADSAEDFLRSDHRHKFNALVISQLRVYHIGRLDIAYLQHTSPHNYQTRYMSAYGMQTPVYGKPAQPHWTNR